MRSLLSVIPSNFLGAALSWLLQSTAVNCLNRSIDLQLLAS